MDYKPLQEAAEQYINNYFQTNTDARFVYHNYTHTQEVVKAAQQIANHYQLTDQDFFIVTIAALFHDTGYFQDPLNHEAKGAGIADEYLEKQGVSTEVRNAVTAAILSTKMPQKPTNLLESILCDADLFHLGTEDFRKKGKLMHQEIELISHKDISKNEWRKKDIEFLENHYYHTDYCNLLLNDQKQKNLEKVKSKLKDTASEAEIGNVKNSHSNKKSVLKKDNKPDKGVETMFRITSANNQRLSDMADHKAQILITVNSIILSAIVSLVLRRLDDNGFLIIPTFLLLLVSLCCVVISILSTRPSIPDGVFTDEDVRKKKVNLLFFGNFYKMSLEKYSSGMNSVMNDTEFLYGTLITDVYSQGVVLGRKYKLIRLAYNVFMYGLVAAILAYVITLFAYGKI
ncbi:MAG: Pycsar system effector family protein [Janthinobacterium lividum]